MKMIEGDDAITVCPVARKGSQAFAPDQKS
jgi:hypothetical protein